MDTKVLLSLAPWLVFSAVLVVHDDVVEFRFAV